MRPELHLSSPSCNMWVNVGQMDKTASDTNPPSVILLPERWLSTLSVLFVLPFICQPRPPAAARPFYGIHALGGVGSQLVSGRVQGSSIYAWSFPQQLAGEFTSREAITRQLPRLGFIWLLCDVCCPGGFGLNAWKPLPQYSLPTQASQICVMLFQTKLLQQFRQGLATRGWMEYPAPKVLGGRCW